MTDLFRLDERLQNDTVFVSDLELCRLLLMNDSRYPWLILVPRRNQVSEIHHLEEADCQQLLKESCQLSAFMTDYFEIKKMNVAVLGNIVPQLHMHHVGRREDDPAWPGPVWGHSAAIAYPSNELDRLLSELRLFRLR